MWNRNTQPYLSDPAIIALVDGVSTTASVSVVRDRIQPDVFKKWGTPAGLWVCRIGSSFHFLPRSNLLTPLTATTCRLAQAQLFVPGDVLTIVEPYLKMTISALAVGATLTFLISGNSHVFTFQGLTGSTPTDVVAELVPFINNSSILKNFVRAVAGTAGVVHLFSQDGLTCHTVAVTGGTVVLSPGGGVMTAQTPVGTISKFDLVDPQLITLTGAATTAVPVGAKVGIYVDEIRGLYPFSRDWTNKPAQLLALVTGAKGVWEDKLPYIDGDIKRIFSKDKKMEFRTRF